MRTATVCIANRHKLKVAVLLRVVQEFSDEQRTQTNNMTDRQNTLVCAFDMRNPRITVFQIQEWLNEKMQLPKITYV